MVSISLFFAAAKLLILIISFISCRTMLNVTQRNSFPTSKSTKRYSKADEKQEKLRANKVMT